ncbi:MAG: GNAT family N-acetyltransferase [Gammaproteobacteria bacterium]|nr:GNAT family N-acetyltransferase [Gammaproteobacteria bacterium]
MAIQTNKISATQINDLLGLFDQYMVFYKQPSAPEKYKNYLLQRISNNEATIYVAYNDNKTPVGFVLNYQSFSSVSQGKTVILNDLFVCPKNRKKGIATQLIACSVALAKEVGAVRVNLATAKDNVSGQALYEKLGFIKDTAYFSYSFSVLS